MEIGHSGLNSGGENVRSDKHVPLPFELSISMIREPHWQKQTRDKSGRYCLKALRVLRNFRELLSTKHCVTKIVAMKGSHCKKGLSGIEEQENQQESTEN